MILKIQLFNQILLVPLGTGYISWWKKIFYTKMTRGGERLLCKAFNPLESKCTKVVTDFNGIEFDVCTNTAAVGYVCKLSAENGDCQNLL